MLLQVFRCALRERQAPWGQDIGDYIGPLQQLRDACNVVFEKCYALLTVVDYGVGSELP
jgi:hypothetical protein